jgi:hypothetical protein
VLAIFLAKVGVTYRLNGPKNNINSINRPIISKIIYFNLFCKNSCGWIETSINCIRKNKIKNFDGTSELHVKKKIP